MSDNGVGYRNPPKHSRFKKGVSGNPKGRPRRQPLEVGAIIENALNAPVEYREGGRTKTASRRELSLRRHVKGALGGDVGSSEALLKLRAQAQRTGNTGSLRVQIDDWLPDHPEQTGEQKTRELAKQDEAASSGWWKRPDRDPGDEAP